MTGSLLGNEVKRVEDPELLRGRGRYVDNLAIEGALHVGFVRSPLAHAEITAIDTAEAAAAPGVVAVHTAADLRPPVPKPFVPVGDFARPALAADRVRFTGEPVAVVVAESAAELADALELVDVDYEPLEVVADPERALDDDAPLQYPEHGSNIALGSRDAAGAEVLDGADVVVRARIENQRMAVVPLEGNAFAAVPGEAGDEHVLTAYASTQMPHGLRDALAESFGWEPEQVRVVAPHVGGAFGGKAGAAAEHVAVVAVALRHRRPARWAETRAENLQAMPHGRGQVQYAELGLRRDGEIVGLRARVLGDCGAHGGFGGSFALGPTRLMSQGTYRIPQISWAGIAVLTNTTPVGAFRGAGRPESAAMLERIIDVGAAELGMDPADLRRRNFLRPADFPHETRTGATYDSGDYDLALTEALRLADYERLRAEQARRRAAGDPKLLGIGMSSYVEITGGGAGEFAAVEVHAEGVTVRVGTSAHGQGHATAFSTIVADQLGVPLESVRFEQSDTAAIPRGSGTGGSRSLQLGGSAVREAGEVVLRKARELAASHLEASPDDIEVTDGGLGVAGVPGSAVAWSELVRLAGDGELSAEADFRPGGATFPFGAHVSVVEVDSETGFATPLRHVAVDDCGRVINPRLVRGQQHGGAVQGIAQALWESYSYDEDGNPLTATLADYAIPSAADVPLLETANTETPTPHNPLGAKGIGESATVGSTPAVQNAVVDALAHLGVRHVDMPATPQRIWRAIRDARAGSPPDPWQEPPAAFDSLPLREGGKPDDADEAIA